MRDWHSLFEKDAAYGYSRSFAFTAGVASLVCLPIQNKRKQATFVNDSDTTIYLCKGPVAALNSGIRLNANGGNYIETPDALGYIWVGAFSCISSLAAKNLCITEDI